MELIPKRRVVIVIFDGYVLSMKDLEHLRRAKAFCADVAITASTICTFTQKNLLSNNSNTHRPIISSIFIENGIEGH